MGDGDQLKATEKQDAIVEGSHGEAAHPVAVKPPEIIGRYRIERVLGQGGFGLVYLAYDEKLQRLVAIKVPHRKLVARPEDAEAYLTEARTVANLDHPNIVPVHDVGSTEQFPCYVVSKYIDGTDLASRLKQSRLNLHAVVDLVATVAEALHYAHKQGLVHRDIKPGNILLDKSGKAFVADFGLALREQDAGKGPRYAGTPAYMSPEQARGEGHRVDGRSDIFSLGVVFYELLVGRKPFRADSQAELLEQITSFEPLPPRQFDDQIPKELDRICLRSLSKRASERYSTAKDVVDDLRHFLGEQSVNQQSGPLNKSSSLPATMPVVQPPSTMGGSVTSVTPTTQTSDHQLIKIVPKGLRSFDAHDSDFFLELLPGPRDRDGLPDSIRFWKTRIEEKDADATFTVGLIYGPSGCGKSSLMKAGLLPRLSENVITVYVEATAEETESRLLHGLRKRCPALTENLSLTDSLATLRRGQGIPLGKKVVIVLDQFEQWLHAKKDEQNTELVQALRQCDGSRVQCVVMVRDDFWLAVSRFMRNLEIRLVEGQNSALVDLFDMDHARKVLAAFGRAFGKLPELGSDTSKDQKDFLNLSVSGLAQEGKVICVRLALFAEMIKGKVWTPTTLKEVGGTEGVGLTFLEEAFSAATAPPEHRYHQKAARAILKSLLPESGTDLKGHMQSNGKLLDTSGYSSRLKDFDDVIRILDSEIRLITPTDPDGRGWGDESSASNIQRGQKYYQLTHDYLVHPLRDWLTRKQKETRRGRAELLLADRSGVWNARPEHRQLPSLWQWIQIKWLTARKKWTPPQRKMMAKASKYYAMRCTALTLILAVTTFAGLTIRDYVNEREKTNYAAALVGRAFDANITQLPAIIQEMPGYRKWIDPLLHKEKSKSTNDPRKQLHISLALLPVDARQAEYLYERLLKADSQELLVIRDALIDDKEGLLERLWTKVESPQNDQDQQFRAACVLSAFAPNDPRWEQVSSDVVRMLLMQKAYLIPEWAEVLTDVSRSLIPSLADSLVDDTRSVSERGVIAHVYRKYVVNTPDEYARRQYTHLANDLSETLGPDANAQQKIALAKKKATIAATLLLLRHGDDVWPLFKYSNDQTMQSYLIEWIGQFVVDPHILVARLDEEQDSSVKRALLLSLGGYRLEHLPVDQRLDLQPRLLQLHRDDPDPGIHAAASWTLHKWGVRTPNLPISEPELSEDQKKRILQRTYDMIQIRQSVARSEEEAPVRQALWERQLLKAVPQPSGEGLVAHYPFNEGSGTEAADAAAGKPSAVYAGQGQADWLPGVSGHAVALNGLGRHFISGIAFDPERTDAFSYGCWFATPYDSVNSSILAKMHSDEKIFYRGIDITTEADGTIGCHLIHKFPENFIKVTSQERFNKDMWNHVFVVYDGSSLAEGIRVYLNGRAVPLQIRANRLTDTIHSSVPFQVGQRDQHFPFNGAIDEVRIYSRCLTHQDVQAIYEAGLRGLAAVPADARIALQQATLEATYRSTDEQLKHLEWQFAEAESSLDDARWKAVRRWYVNGQGQTMVMIRKPANLSVNEGSEPGIDHDFAISSTEVTVEQFGRFLSDFQETKERRHLGTTTSTTDCPANGMTWYEAVAYCNWLSKKEGVPVDQWCYLPNKEGEYAAGMSLPPDYQKRMGYRLPTEAEFRYACRNGTNTYYSFGEKSEELLGKYAWFDGNSKGVTHPVGTLKANDLGIFDMQGNVQEWCQDTYGVGLARAEPKDQTEFFDQQYHTARGGSFFLSGEHANPDNMTYDFQQGRHNYIGVRPVRTLELAPVTPPPDNPQVVADLLMEGDDEQFRRIFPTLVETGESGSLVLSNELSRKVSLDVRGDARRRLAKRQANAAVALLKLRQPENVWLLLKHSSDPTLRSNLIHGIGRLGVNPKTIIQRLNDETDTSIRRALFLILGEFRDESLSQDDRAGLLPILRDIYRHETDPGLHSAVEWLLRRFNQEEWLKQTNEEWMIDKGLRGKRLEGIKQSIANGEKLSAQWLVNGQGQMEVVMPGPVEFLMGKWPHKAKRTISQMFAIAAKEVTVEQYLRFRKEHKYNEGTASTVDAPVNSVSWYDAVAYCNWLSEQEGIPSSEWCYLPNEAGQYASGMRIAVNHLERTGYRLPVEAEWEYFCRAGAETEYSFGEKQYALGQYAWYGDNRTRKLHPVGLLKPNDLGLWDMHGNAGEWVNDVYQPLPTYGTEVASEDVGDLMVSDNDNRVLRGGSSPCPDWMVSCVIRFAPGPKNNTDVDGFRVARTIRIK